VDASGKLLASSPATNFPFAQTNPVRQALNGRSAVGPIEDGGAVALLAAAPFRQGDRVVGAILALQRLNGDLLTSAVRDTGLSAALVTQGRIVAATSALRTRITAERNPTIGLIPASSGQPGRLTIGSSVFDVASQAVLAPASGREIILVVGLPPASDGVTALLPRSSFDWVSALGAALLAGLIGWLLGSVVGRSVLELRMGSGAPSALAGREVAMVAAALAAERGAGASREADARDEATRLRAVLDAIDEGIVVSDPERRVIATNAAARTFLGLNGAGTTSAVLALLPPEGSAEFRA